MRSVMQPTTADLDRARIAVRQHLQPTPLIPIGNNRWLKLESQQPTGAFKLRGAIAALSRYPAGTSIVTASAGNHAIGIAWSASRIGHNATIVVPESVSPKKLEILREMGANVVLAGDGYEAAEAHALALADQGGIYVSAYNDPHVIAGQASIVDELVTEVAGDFTIIVPIGGGGLISGITLRAAQVADRRIKVIGVEAEASQAVSASVAAGHTVVVPIGETLADGLAGNLESDSITVEILKQYPPIFTMVTEPEIQAAIRKLYREHDLVAEGAAATSFAVMQRMDVDEPLVAIISGRNIASDLLNTIVS